MVTGFAFKLGVEGDFTSAMGQKCGHCGERIHSDPAVVWSFFTATVYWCEKCAPDWLPKFARDVWQLEHELRAVGTR